MSHRTEIQLFVVENFLFGDGARLQDDTSLHEEGIIDSTGVLEVILFLEQTYHIHIEDEELVPQNLDSVINIDRFLERKLKEMEEIAGHSQLKKSA